VALGIVAPIMERQYKTDVEFPGGVDWDFLEGLEALLVSLTPAGTHGKVQANETDGRIAATSFHELRSEVRNLAGSSWAIETDFGSDPTILLWVATREGSQGSLRISGSNEAAVFGLAATVRRRLDRGDVSSTPPSVATTAISDQPRVFSPQGSCGEIVASPILASRTTPTADAEPTLMRRAFNHPWFVGITVGLVIAILVTVLVILNSH
jgi:hypothetical protein